MSLNDLVIMSLMARSEAYCKVLDMFNVGFVVWCSMVLSV